jgi:c-di-GMP-binding flagellar brake protein YcgR
MPPKKGTPKKQSPHLNIELASDLLLQFKGIKGFFPSYLIGMKPDVFLIIKSPTIITTEDLLSEGSALVVRYTFLGDVYRFKTDVLGSNQEPFKVTFLTYPSVVEKIEFRDSQRVHCFFPATLLYDKIKLTGMITDISLGGCKFKTDAVEQVEGLLLKKEGDVTLQFPLLGHKGTKEFKGKIKKAELDINFALGIGFRSIDDDARRVIASYVESASEYK